jgi:PilZ domain
MIGLSKMGQPDKTGNEPNQGEEQNTGDELQPCEEQKTPEEPKKDEKPKADEDLRRSPRLQCSGSAGVQTLPNTEKPVPAKIINLSIGGCLMDLKSPIPLAVDETVELIFCVNNWPFRVRGKVRSIRSETLIGFQFPQLSDRIRRQLEDLVGELIDHLVRLHKETIAHRTAEDDAKLPHAPPAPAARSASPLRPRKSVEGRPDYVDGRIEPRRKWL